MGTIGDQNLVRTMGQAQRLADDLKKAVAQAERARIERQSQLKLLEVEAAAQEAELQRDLDQAKTKLQKLARKRQDTVPSNSGEKSGGITGPGDDIATSLE
ncbi:unnamed protein product [Cladocopium goreaui]|uniref:Uncharacterized protein n=1 Tax=Cladocopium goreaui TaxID=2562237 RepID=A0A9P1D8B4_9DINO|nr:unnamed protein product [Cladocopium goreaui]